MPVTVRCPNPDCRKASTVDDANVGRVTQCKHCGSGIVVRPAAPTHGPASQTDDSKTAPTPAGESPRHCIGRFEIRAKLGSGAFGTVYRAHDPQLDREVALKVPNPGVLNNPKRVERFLREARASAQLRHPNIVPVFDAGRDGDSYYIASAFIDGQPLSDAVEEKGMDFRRAARIVRELAEAVGYAHGQGIVHRDIKPDNVMLDKNDRPHLMDFGLASRVEGKEKLTNDGQILGTPAYMAPEQATGKQGEVKAASDQYALAVVLYELLTGNLPFEGTPEIVLFNAINVVPKSPRELRFDVPRDLETICLKAMAKLPQDRYADCESLASDLRRWLAGEQIEARRLGLGEQFVRWCRKEPRLALVTLGMLASLLTVALVLAVSAAHQATLTERAETNADRAMAAKKEADEARQREVEARQEVVQQWTRAEEAAAREKAKAAQLETALEESREKQTALEKSKAEIAREVERAQLAEKNAEEQRRAAVQAREQERVLLEAESRRVEFVRYAEYSRNLAQVQQLMQASNVTAARLALDASDMELRDWEWHYLDRVLAKRGEAVFGFRGLEQSVEYLTHSPDGRWLAGAVGNTVRVWYAPGVKLVGNPDRLKVTLKHNQGVRGIAFSPDGSTVASATQDGAIRIWEALTGKELGAFQLHKGAARTVAFSPKGTLIASGGADGSIQVNTLDLVAEKPKQFQLLWKQEQGGAVNAIAFNQDGKIIATAGDDKSLQLWDEKGARLHKFNHADPVSALAFDPDSTRIATAAGNSILIWDAISGEKLYELRGHSRRVTGVAFLPERQRLVSCAEEGELRIWHSKTSQLLLVVKDRASPALCIAASPDGQTVATGYKDRAALVRDGSPERKVVTINHQGDGVIALSPDGKTLAACSLVRRPKGVTAQLNLWNADTGQPIAILPTATQNYHSLAFSPDGRSLAGGGTGKIVEVWEVATGKLLHNFGSSGIRVGDFAALSARLGLDFPKRIDFRRSEKLVTICG